MAEPRKLKYKYCPRNDFVVYRVFQKPNFGGVALPEISEAGKDRIVLAIGPKVEGLKVGDRILPVGKIGENMAYLNEDPDCVITKEENVALILEYPDGE